LQSLECDFEIARIPGCRIQNSRKLQRGNRPRKYMAAVCAEPVLMAGRV